MKWLNDLSLDTFSGDAQEAYDRYKAQYAKAKQAREEWERMARAEIASEHGVNPDCIAFSYRFGKLSLGLGEARPAKRPAAKQSLSDWLASQD